MTDRLPLLALMTDFGLEDVYVGVMKSVILERCPTAAIIDLSHSISPQNIHQAAYLLWTAYRFLPEGAVVVCVVDPGVGTERDPVAIRWPRGHFVGPDNGWLSYLIRDARSRDDGAGQMPVPDGWSAVRLDNALYHLDHVSRTFHGRDIFAPAAAALAGGVAVDQLGSAKETLTTVEISVPTMAEGRVVGKVIHVDHFGNLITDIPSSFLGAAFSVLIRGGSIDGPADSYQGDQPLLAIVGSAGNLEIAAPNGNARKLIGAEIGETIVVTSRRSDPQPADS